jgi:hypothetical protein
VILHSRADVVIPFADSEELVRNSRLPIFTLIEIGHDHRLADPESLELMLAACRFDDDERVDEVIEDIHKRDWAGLCYSAAISWIGAVDELDWLVVHGTVWSEEVGKRIEHAWCERGETVVDLAMPVGARIIERAAYYRVIKPEIRKTYSSDDALILSIRNGHHGLWDES